MNKKMAMKPYERLLGVALDKIKRAIYLASNVTSEASWIEFNTACNEADVFIFDALVSVALKGLVPKSDEEKLYASLKKLDITRIEASVNWEMARREAEAITNPTGKYGLMRARRLKMEAALQDQDEDDSGNGDHSPKP